MLIIYPSSETKTRSTFPAWASLFLLGLASLVYLFKLLPLEEAHRLDTAQAAQKVFQQVERQVQSGNLDEKFSIRVEENIEIIGLPEMANVFPRPIHRAYEAYRQNQKPLEKLAESGPESRIFLALMPHHWFVLLLGVFCFLSAGFLLEHLFDRQIFLGLWVLLSFGFVMGEDLIPALPWPSPVLAWSHSLGAMILISWILAPTAQITMTIRGWFFKVFELRTPVPTFAFPALFWGGVALFNFKYSEYSPYFEFADLVPIAVLALIFGLIVSMFPNRGEVFVAGSKSPINQELARAESYFGEERHEEAFSLMRGLLEMKPSAAQVKRIADLAWENHQTELADRCYKILLREALQSQNFEEIVSMVELILFRDLPISGSVLSKTLSMALKKKSFTIIRKLLPHYQVHPEINEEELDHFHEKLAASIAEQETPDREFLYELKSWFSTRPKPSPWISKIDKFLQQFAGEAGLETNYSGRSLVHKHLDIAIQQIASTKITIRTDNQEKQIPWTAVSGFFGAKVGPQEEPWGCLLVKFKRKIFACQFPESALPKTGDFSSFEEAWQHLKRYAPEDLPFVPFTEFEVVSDREKFEFETQWYARKYLG